MTGVETIARIRFEHFQNGKGIKRIARDRQFVKILARVPEDGIAAVADACAEALEAGIANGDVVMAILAQATTACPTEHHDAGRPRRPDPPPSMIVQGSVRRALMLPSHLVGRLVFAEPNINRVPKRLSAVHVR
jgi:hypothetical protein